MKKRILGKHFIRHWREYRGLSLAKLAARMEAAPGEELMSGMSLSRIERGQQPYSEELLNALSDALSCSPWELISVDPSRDGDVIDLMRFIHEMDKKKAEKALAVLKAALAS